MNCYHLAQSLSKKKISTTVFSGRSTTVHVEKLNDYLEIVRLPCLNFPPRYLWFQLQNLGIFRRLLRNFTILHAVNPISSAFSVGIKKKLRIPLVTTNHGDELNALKLFANSPLQQWTIGDFNIFVTSYPLQQISIKACLRDSNHIVVPGYFILELMKRTYPYFDFQKTSVIHNGIILDEIERKKQDSDQISSSILYYGQLIYRKGILYLVRAMAAVQKNFPECRLNIVGRGPLENKIKKEVLRLNLQDVIRFQGYLPNTQLISEVKKASLVVLPSIYETGPFIAALEAMACKRPLVTFNLPFTREFISHMENGVLAQAGSVKDLSSKIELLLSDRKLCRRLGENAYLYVKKKHDWNVLVEKYVDVYQKLCA